MGVRLETDFDAFFEREDAAAQLQHWREEIASTVLGLPASEIQLGRIRRGSLDLEFVVEGISAQELQQRLDREADRLRALFQEPVLEVRVDGSSGAEPGGDSRPQVGQPGPGPQGPGGQGGHGPVPALRSPVLRRPPASSPREQLEARIRAAEAEYGFDLSVQERLALDAGPVRLAERLPDTSPPKLQTLRDRDLHRLNHPTSAEGPRFLMRDSYWDQRQGERIREQPEAMFRRGLLKEEFQVLPFRAKPVPVGVLTPRMQGRRSRSAEGPRGVAVLRDREEPPFRARPVPWRVSTPMYEQLLLEEREARHTRCRSRSLELLRSASLPPRMEALRRLEQERGQGSRSPGRAGPWHGEPYSARRWLASEAQQASRDSAGRKLGLGPEYGYTSPAVAARGDVGTAASRGSPLPRSGAARPRSASAPRRPEPRTTTAVTEVPDFAARHEHMQQQLERRKYLNRYVTQPEPFVFFTPSRSETRQPPMPKDPGEDWRYHRRAAGRPQSQGTTEARGRRAVRATGADIKQRSTQKVLSSQLATMRRLQEKREKEQREREELEQAQAVDEEMKERVKQAVGPIEPMAKKIERMVDDKRRGLQRVQSQKRKDIDMMLQRANNRPLLMQQADTVERARRRALFRVRNALRQAGVRDVNRHFGEEELDELDRGDAAAGIKEDEEYPDDFS